MADPVRIVVTILGEPLELVLPGMGWDYDEAKLAKNVSEGLTPVEIEGRLLLGDPDAWMGVLRVSFLRAGRDPAGLEKVNIMELIAAITGAVEEKLAELPPTSASASESPALDESSESEPSEGLSSE